ncbi:ATP-binding protein [Methylocystis sp. 9N]|uniref:histidine kinase n=1 Tax=Methylocystis borbori TaxID=3118750 RepID=A0ABU7XE26_9HYPH
MTSRVFSWRLPLKRLAVQITLLILVSIVAFQTIVIVMFHVLDVEGRRHIVDQSDFIASVIVAIDVADVSQRAHVLSEFSRAAPYANIAIVEARPPFVDPLDDDSEDSFDNEIKQVAALLWDDADVFRAVSPQHELLAVGLRKGGYALISIAQHRKPPRSVWRWLWQDEPGEPFILTPWARAALSFFMFAAIFVFWTSNAIMAPLKNLAKYAEGIPNDVQSDTQLAERGPQEVRELTRSINRMQARIRQMIAARAHVLAAVSHDLRTIITRLKLKAEFMSDRELQQRMLRDIDLMDAMLYKNLQYLRAEGDDTSDISLIDLDSVLQTVANEFGDLGYDVKYDRGPRQMILGSLSDVQRIFNNLVENATHHAKTVEISMAELPGERIQVDVVDDGPGIPAEAKESAFEPFVRGEPARTINKHSGFGLGLSIVRSLVEHHGGTVQLLDRAPHGLIVRVVLPQAVEGSEKSAAAR